MDMKYLMLVMALTGCGSVMELPEEQPTAVAPVPVPSAAPPGTPTISCDGFRNYQGGTWGPDANGGWVWYNSIFNRIVARYQANGPDGAFDSVCYDVTPAPTTASISFGQGDYPWTFVMAFLIVGGVNTAYTTHDGWTFKKTL